MALSKITNSGIGAVDTLAVDTDTLVVDSTNNRVGVGITAPDVHLHLQNDTNPRFRVEDTTNNVKFDVLAQNNDVKMGNSSNHDLRIITNNAERMRIDSSGRAMWGITSYAATPTTGITFNADSNASVNIGHTSSPSGYLYVNFGYGGTQIGSITQSGTTSVAYNTSSDYRLKENVVADWDATTRLKQLNPVRFNFIADADTTVDGFLAHEVQDVVPEAISGTKDAMMDEEYEVTPAVLDEDGNVVTPAVMGTRSVPDYQGIDQSKLVPLLVKTIQELEARIVALETA